MHGVGGDERAGRGRDLLEQRRERGDFVALRGNGNLVERQAQVMGDGHWYQHNYPHTTRNEWGEGQGEGNL